MQIRVVITIRSGRRKKWKRKPCFLSFSFFLYLSIHQLLVLFIFYRDLPFSPSIVHLLLLLQKRFHFTLANFRWNWSSDEAFDLQATGNLYDLPLLIFLFLSSFFPLFCLRFSLPFSLIGQLISVCLSIFIERRVSCHTKRKEKRFKKEKKTSSVIEHEYPDRWSASTVKILMFYFFLFYRLSQSTKLHPRVLITSIAKTQRGKFSRVSSLLACTAHTVVHAITVTLPDSLRLPGLLVSP